MAGRGANVRRPAPVRRFWPAPALNRALRWGDPLVMISGVDTATNGGCWHCGRHSDDDTACAWCGVWLVDLDPGRVPTAVRPLLPLARRWGISDDGYRADAVRTATRAELASLVDVVDGSSGPDLDAWLIGPEATSDAPSHEYVAITCLTMAADHAGIHLERLGD